jgi:hypothetical protein
MKSVALPPQHYASGWKTEGAVRSTEEVNDLGRRYAGLPDGREKEDLLLEICQADGLMERLVTAVKGYDPTYKDKVRLVVETIDNELSKRRVFSAADINRSLDIDRSRYLRLLGRVGVLQKEGQSFIRFGEMAASGGVRAIPSRRSVRQVDYR